MINRKARLVLLVIIVLAIIGPLGGCDFAILEPPSDDTDLGDVTVPASTKVFNEEDLGGLADVSEDQSTFTFSEDAPAVDGIETGDVIVGGVSSKTPEGFLRKVTSVEQEGGSTRLSTTQATLTEAVKEGTIAFQRNLDPADLEKSIARVEGARLVRGPVKGVQKGEFFMELRDVVLYDADGDERTKGDQIKVNGGITFDPTIDFRLEIDNFAVQSFRFAPEMNTSADLDVSASVRLAELEARLTIHEHYFSPIVVGVGGFPVVFVPRLDVNVDLNGSVSVGMSTGVNYEVTTTSGIEYADRQWAPVSDFQHEANHRPLEASAGGNAELYLATPLNVLLYGFVGPYVQPRAGLQANVDLLADPWWNLFFAVELGAGARLDIIGMDEIEKNYPGVIGFRVEIASADGEYDGGDDDDGITNTSFSDDFDDGDYTSSPEWLVDNDDDYPGEVSVEDGAAKFYRTGAGGNGGTVGLYKDLNIEVTGSTKVSFDAKAVSRSVGAGCGWTCGEYPANVQLTVEDEAGNEYVAKYSVNYGSDIEDKERSDFKQFAISIPRDTWERGITYTITDAWPQATRITKVVIYGNGWDFEGYVDNLAIGT